ncbi:MAG: pilus assembly protein PilM [Bdellovibrionales bacterium]|nr:pilus assembly protein PilM [Bdellovibrionales bacterium]
MNFALDWYRNLSRNRPSLGVDIGDRSIKGVSLKKDGDLVVLEDIFYLDLSEMNDMFPENKNVIEKLAAVIEVNELQNKKVALTGGGRMVSSFDLTLPKMAETELQLVVEKNLEETLRKEISSVCFDYKIIPGSDPEMVHVRIYHSLRKDVDHILDIAEAAHLKPVTLSTSILSAAQMLRFNRYTDEKKGSILIDLGEASTSISLLMGHEVVASNSTKKGFGEINRQLMQQLDCSYFDAEEVKPYVNHLADIGNPEVEEIVDSVYMNLLEPLQETIDFYRSQDMGLPVSEIFFVGGGTSIGDIAQIFEDHYYIPATVVNPFRKIETVKEGESPDRAIQIEMMAPFMGSAVGLALEGIDW